MPSTYRFNRPLSLLFLLPMVLLLVMLVMGLLREFSVLPFVLTLLSLLIVGAVIYFSMLRSLTIDERDLSWNAPGKEWRMKVAEVQHFGIVKYRSFRFIYLSRADGHPFEQADARIVTSQDTFVIQYREKAWLTVKALMKSVHPELEAENMERGR